MNAKCYRRVFLVLGCLWLIWGVMGVQAADEPQRSKVDQLAIQQGVVADKYAKLEKLLDDMARIEGLSNPRRAALLMQALRQSKENLTAVKLDACVKLLNQEQLNRALENQRDAHKDMQTLLELLLSENRSDRLKSEQDRIREYIREVERILRLQKSVQGRTEGGGEQGELAKDQNKVAERTGELARRIQENEEGQPPTGTEGQPAADSKKPPNGDSQGPSEEKQEAQDGSKSEPGDAQGTGKKEPSQNQGQEKSEPQKPAEAPEKQQSPGGKQDEEKDQGQSKDGSQGEKSGQNQKQGEQQPSPGQPGQQPSDQQSPQDQSGQQQANPARQRIEAAEQRMRDAQQRLEEAKRKDAVAEQEKAKEELEKAEAELERILRQLREEEVERTLAMLEGRFRKMLEVQIRIYEDTIRLDKADDELRKQKDSGRLASEERKLGVEADKALNILLEEGSSIAFPETVSQMRDDMQQVAERLDAANVGKITQGVEEDIIAALEEMIEALQKAQQDMEQRRQQPQNIPVQPMDMPLVDALSELKMIRALQMRVNTRTQRYARLLENTDDPTGQATEPGLVDALSKLAERQESIYRITRDLVLGKNR
jgi:hypothetical protein